MPVSRFGPIAHKRLRLSRLHHFLHCDFDIKSVVLLNRFCTSDWRQEVLKDKFTQKYIWVNCFFGKVCLRVFSCCLLCLLVTVTPGYFCCRGTSLFSPSFPLNSVLLTSVCLFHSRPLNPFSSFGSIPLLLCLCLCVWGLRKVYLSASIMPTIQTRRGQALDSFLFMCVLDEYCKLKAPGPGCGQAWGF